MKITHNDRTQQFSMHNWWKTWKNHPERREALAELAREGVITDDDDVPITGRRLQLLRDRMLATYDDLPPVSVGRRSEGREPGRFLIPGLWPWGTIPALGGNFKAGKSTIVTDLTRALVVPGYRFLDHFDPVEGMEELERGRGVNVINAETPWQAFEAAMDNGMPKERWDYVQVEHLEELGGAQFMDLTDPVLYDMWAYRLTQCFECDGSDDGTPFAVIVDGVTAILQAAGKTPDDFGLWYAAFRRLLREVDVPNGLATGHNTMAGGHLMGGTAASAGPDGLWTYSAEHVDRPKASRWFSVRPRMGGVQVPPTRVVMSEEGRPVVPSSSQPEQELGAEAESDFVTVVAERTAEYVRAHPGASGQELTENVDDGGWKENNLKGRTEAVRLGLIREEKCRSGCAPCKEAGRPPHNRRTHYWPQSA